MTSNKESVNVSNYASNFEINLNFDDEKDKESPSDT